MPSTSFLSESLAAIEAQGPVTRQSATSTKPGSSSTPVTPAPSTSAPPATAATPPAIIDTKPAQLQGDAAILQSLKNALGLAGVDFSSLGLEAHNDIVTYPGGAYLNSYISVTANGHTEGLMTNLVGINPNVAVLDIKHMLGQG